MKKTIADKDTRIRIGSIIHLENRLPKGGFLDTRGRIADKPVITKFHDPRVLGFVSTHESANRFEGSGSWQVWSAVGKGEGEPVVFGDKIYLLSMHSGAGYLDSFEWVRNLEPFKDFPVTIGVFTSSVPNRGGGQSGTWTVRSAAGKRTGEEVVADDAIYLENDYPGAGNLCAYGEELVTNHPMFQEYAGQLKFVFTGPSSHQEGGSDQWTITLSRLLESFYYVQHQWGDSSAPWHDGGVFKIGGRAGKTVVALKYASEDGGNKLSGTMTYKREGPIGFRATRVEQNIYSVETQWGGSFAAWHSDGNWRLGSRDVQRIVAMDVASKDDGHSLNGTITYSGEGPIRFQGVREAVTINDLGQLVEGSSRSDLLQGRTKKIEGVLDATYKLLSDSYLEISGTTINKAIQLGSAESEQSQDLFDDIDRDFQLKQLLNLYTLSQTLNSFLRKTLQELIKQSLEKHQLDRTLAPLHLIRSCFQHVAADHEIIQQATIQRRWNKHLDGRFYISEQALELLIMDKLAIKAIAPFQHLLSEDQDHLAVITYLSEKTHIHHLPYAKQFIVIGLSYDRVPPAASLFDGTTFIGKNFPASELMAIPHEIGHHVYQHGKLKDGKTFPQITEQFQDNPYYQWCEEIFSDLYGCIVAGPLSALSMQALLVSIDRQRVWKDDEEHPTPLLRVFILAEMLRVLHDLESTEKGSNEGNKRYRFSKVPKKLDEDWAAVLERWGYERLDKGHGRPRRIYLPDDTAVQLDKIVNVERVVQAVRPIIIEFATYLLNATKMDPSGPDSDDWLLTTIPWSQGDYDLSEPYNDEMVGMTSRSFARKKVARQILLSIKNDHDLSTSGEMHPEKRLLQYLAEWGDSGPTGSSGGTHAH